MPKTRRRSSPLRVIAAAAILQIAAAAILQIAASALSDRALAAQLFVLDHAARNDPAAQVFTPQCNVKLVGEIRQGDAERIGGAVAAFKSSPLRPPPAPPTQLSSFGLEIPKHHDALCLASDGGDIREALRIAEHFKGWMTVIEAGDTCISACSILFMKGGRRDGVFRSTNEPGRYLHHQGRLGFHAPRLEVAGGDQATLPVAEVAAAYSRAVRTIGAIIFAGVISADDPGRSSGPPARVAGPERTAETTVGIRPGDEFLPLDLLLAFLSVPPDEIYFVSTLHELMSWGIEPYGFASPPHVSQRMLLTACLNVASSRCLVRGTGEACISERVLSGFGTFGQGRLDDGFFDQFKIYRMAVTQNWPKVGAPKGRLTELGFAMARERPRGNDPKDYPCVIRARYEGARLLDLDIETFNGDGGPETIESGRLFATTDGHDGTIEKDHRLRFYPERRLRLWKMLPAGTRLDELGTAPWSAVATGGAFFIP